MAYGRPMSPPLVRLNDFTSQWEVVSADVHAAVERVGRSGWLILGSEVKTFEAELAQASGLGHAVGVASGLDAIEIALRTLGLPPGAKVLTTPLTAFATTLAIVRAGLVPVYVDVDASGLVDLGQAEALLASRSDIAAFVPVHLYGHALDGERLSRIAAKVPVLEDAAQAILAKSRGVPVGSVGFATATSFYPTKNLGALGDGGAVLTRDAAVADGCRVLRDYGQRAKYVHDELGLNSRLDELHAGILRTALLPRLAAWTARRREIAGVYLEGLRGAKGVKLPPVPDGSESVWHLFPTVVQGDRAAAMKKLADLGIQSAVHYPRLAPHQPALAQIPYEAPALPVADELAAQELSLPIHPFLTDAEVARVIDAVKSL